MQMMWLDPETIDLTWSLATGAPLGPFRILDIVGLETAYNIVCMDPRGKRSGDNTRKDCKTLERKNRCRQERRLHRRRIL